MCVLTFYYNNEGITEEEQALLKHLLSINSVKNSDGTGFFTASGKTFHSVEPAMDVILPEDFSGERWILAHTRKISSGEKSIENTHPIIGGNVVIAHNGTMYQNVRHEDSKRTFPDVPWNQITYYTYSGKIWVPEKKSDTQRFVEAFTAADDGSKTLPQILKEAFEKFEHGSYAMLIAWNGEPYLLVGENTVHQTLVNGNLLLNTDLENIYWALYVHKIYGHDTQYSIPKPVPVGLYKILPDRLEEIDISEVAGPDGLFLKKKVFAPVTVFPKQQTSKISGTTVVQQKITAAPPAATSITVSKRSGLKDFFQGLAPYEAGALIVKLSESFSEEELLEMMTLPERDFLDILILLQLEG